MTLDIAAIKARAEKATGAFITCVAGDGKPYVKFQFKELKAAQSFYAAFFDGRTDIPALIDALEAEREWMLQKIKSAYRETLSRDVNQAMQDAAVNDALDCLAAAIRNQEPQMTILNRLRSAETGSKG